MKHYFYFLLLLAMNGSLCSKIRILTFHCNQADFIEMQYKTFQKFLVDDFEMIVFNDAKTEENKQWIECVCDQYQIHCVRFEPQWHLENPLNTYLQQKLQEPSTIGCWGWNAATSIEEIANNASVRHSHVIQYALDHYGYDHEDIVVLMDGDNFLIQPLSIRNLLGSNDMIGFNQRPDEWGEHRIQNNLSVSKGKELLWVVFIAFHPRKLPDLYELQFHVDVISDHAFLPQNTISDTGAAIHRYLAHHPNLKLQAYPWQFSYTYRSWSHDTLKRIGMSDRFIKFIHDIAPGDVQFFVFEHFMHFGAGSFESPSHHYHHKVQHLRTFIEDILK